MSFNPTATIERCPHDPENPYTMINTALIRDENLHPVTRMILISLLSNKPGWKITCQQFVNLYKPHGIGRNKILSYFKQACEVGYMKKEKYKDGNLNRTRWILSEKPKFKKSFPQSGSQTPNSESPGFSLGTPDSQTLSINNSSKEEFKRKEDYAEASPPSLFSFKRVKMQAHHYKKLVEEFGQDKIDEMVDRLEEYADINPKRFKGYANHATVIRKWIREETEKNGQISPSKNIELATTFKEKNNNLFRRNEAVLEKDALAFTYGSFYLRLPFADKNFKIRLIDQLTKMRLSTSWIK